jgi:hypothetical protein
MGKKEPESLSLNILMKDLIIQLNLLTQVHITCVITLFKICLNGWFITLDVISKKHQRRRQLVIMNIRGAAFFFLKSLLFSCVFFVRRLWSLLYYFHGVSTPRLEISDGMLFMWFSLVVWWRWCWVVRWRMMCLVVEMDKYQTMEEGKPFCFMTFVHLD